MTLSKALGEIRQRAQASHREPVEIERLAGIADAAENKESFPPF
jgi:hypothetical protein